MTPTGARTGRRLAVGLLLATATTIFWLGFGLANGPTVYNDTPAYRRVADAFLRGEIVTSARTPGYPLLLVACHGLATVLGTDFLRTTMVVQVLLLSGLGTWLVYDLGVRLTGRIWIGAVAALLAAVDADLQNFGAYILTEALTVTLAVLALWLRVRDGGWERAAWVLAALALVRPNYVLLPFVFAGLDFLRTRQRRALLAPAWPTVAVLVIWAGVSLAAGTDPLEPQKWFVPMHTFGKVYEQDLWVVLPDGPERRLLATQRALGADPYQARLALERLGGDGTAWRLTQQVIRADRLAYLGAIATTLRREFRQASFLVPAHPQRAWLDPIQAWRNAFRGFFYASYVFFALLVALATVNGIGWPDAEEAFRRVLAPFLVVLFVTTASSSMGTWDVGRLSVAFHPLNALLWALLAGQVAVRLRPARSAAYST